MGPSRISNATRRKVYLVSALFTILSSLTPPLRLLALSGERLLPGEPGDDRHGAPPPDNSLPGSLRPSLALDNNRLIFSPEYSERTGFSLGASYAIPLTDHTALGLLGAIGADKKEFLINAGFDLTETQRLIATFGQLRQDLDFSFRSGDEKAGMTMNSGALSYQFYLGKGLLNAFEVNGYLADTSSNDLADKTYAVDTATLYELWNDPRRVAGGRVTGMQGRLVFAPLPGATFKLGLGGEELEYDYLTGKDTTNQATSSAEWTQQLADGYTVQAGANAMAAMDRYAIGISRALSGGHRVGVDFSSLQGRDGVPDDNQIRLAYSYGFSSGNASAHAAKKPTAKTALSQAEPVAPPKDTEKPSPAWSAGLLAQVAHRPSFLPSQVVAKVDPTATPTRLVAIDKTTLPAGAAIDAATGIITAPLGVAVLSIAGVTLNGGPFVNTGQFSLSGNSIVINPALITQPAVGVTDTYAVTINNVGGGTTLATILISHGSVRIDSITITHSADTTPPTTTAAPSVSGTTDIATTLAATINENGTGYYLVQAAAAAAPDAATVIAANHTFAMTANVQATANISGLVASTAYKVYFVAKDTAGNTQAAVGSVAVTTNAPAIDVAPTVAAPTVTKTDTAVTVTNHINDTDGVQNITYSIYSDAAATILVNSNTSGAAFSGLTASTNYWVKTTAETRNGATGTWTLQTSPTLAVTTNASGNVAPTANNFTYATDIGNAAKTFDWKVLSAATDADGDPLAAAVQAQGTKGTFAIAGDNVTYTPNASQTGSDTGTLRISDGQGGTKDVTATVNNIDTLAPDALTGGPTLAAVGGVYYSKLATSNVTVTATTGEGRIWLNGANTGVDLIAGGSYNYDANVVEGNNNFSYTLKDALGNESSVLAFSVFRDTLVPVVNDLPNWGAGVASGSTTAKTVTMTDNNAFAGSSVVSISASAGSITGFDSSTYGTNKPFNYVAPVNPNGSGALTVTLTYTIRDAANNLTTQTQTFDVIEAPAANVAPTANNFTYGVNIGNTAKTFDWKVLSAAADVNGDTLTATVQAQGTHGTFAIGGDNLTYTPGAGYVGSDISTLRISDGQGGTKDITVTVNGIDTNLAPTITDLPNFGGGVASGSTTAGKSVTFGDETAWGAGSTVSISANGGATIANITPDMTSYGVKTFDFIAPVNPAGSGPLPITITYTVTDANGVQTQTTQTVDVAEAANNLPVANNVTRDAAGAAGITYDLALDISDVETPDAGLTIVVDAPPVHIGAGGSFVWNSNTQFTLTVDGGYTGSDSFTYHVVDGLGGISTTKTVTINNLSN